MEAFRRKSCKVLGKHCEGDERNEPGEAILDKRTKTSFSPESKEPARKTSFFEGGNWLLAGKDACSDYGRLSPVLPSSTGADTSRTSSRKLVNVLCFSELLVKKLTIYGTAISFYPSHSVVSTSCFSSFSLATCKHFRLNPAGICLLNLAESILTPSRKSFSSTRAGASGERECLRRWIDKWNDKKVIWMWQRLWKIV